MKENQWLCISCNKVGVCACFELSDMVHIPDMTIGPSHHAVSPDCTAKKILFIIEGQIFQWAGGGCEPQASAFLADFVLAEDILRLITAYEQKVVIIDAKALVPKTRALIFKNAVKNAEKETEILIYDSLPHNPGKLFFSHLKNHIRGKGHAVIFVGNQGTWRKWQDILQEHGEFSLLCQSSQLWC